MASFLQDIGTKVGAEFKSHRLRIEEVEQFKNSLSVVANKLQYTDTDSVTHDIADLSLYLDDTNLARIISGTYDSDTQELVFTRDDSSTFRVDASMFFQPAGDYVSAIYSADNHVPRFNGDNGQLQMSDVVIDDSGNLTALSVAVGYKWVISRDSSTGSLIFTNNGVDLMKLDTSGNLTVVGDITAYGTI